MGTLLSRFRKKKTTRQELDEIEKELKCLDDFQFATQRRKKRIIGNLILYSIVLYIITLFVYYFYYFPTETQDQIIYSSPFLLIPVIIWGLNRFVAWYFKRQLIRQEEDKADLRRRKRKILDTVKETETYIVAKEILEKYDPDQKKKKAESSGLAGMGLLSNQMPGSFSATDLRRRSAPVRAGPGSSVVPSSASHTGIMRPAGSVNMMTGRGGSPIRMMGPRPPGPPMPRPVPPRERSVIDRMVDYMMGEGPGHKFALICQRCQSHNGMASPDEYDYMAFRCCYCYHWNPARKQRPFAPRLPYNPTGSPARASASDSSDRESSPARSDAKPASAASSVTAVAEGGSSADESDNEESHPKPESQVHDEQVSGTGLAEAGDQERMEVEEADKVQDSTEIPEATGRSEGVGEQSLPNSTD